jgi:hypothetical protein
MEEFRQSLVCAHILLRFAQIDQPILTFQEPWRPSTKLVRPIHVENSPRNRTILPRIFSSRPHETSLTKLRTKRRSDIRPERR